MNELLLARWQFATTTVYHFLLVPLSIGLTLAVAIMQTMAYRAAKKGTEQGDADAQTWDRAARFWGRIMLVLFALGVVTGIVQEFQFGMNWSQYSRFVGDIFGAPLAMEALIAFFLESVFFGVWLFGRGLLSPKMHTVSIWLAAAGTTISAYFILAANSFMQHPVGWTWSEEKHRAELTSIWKVLTNSSQLVTFPHTILAAWLTASAILLSVSAWHMRRNGEQTDPVHKKVAGFASVVMIFSMIAVSIVGHIQGQIMTSQQPMKMAAAEALWDTKTNAPFSLFAVGDVTHGKNKVDIAIPGGLSFLATNSFNGKVQGINDIQRESEAAHGPGSYIPVVWLAYWCFRLMIGFGVLAGAIGFWFWVQKRRGKLYESKKMLRIATWVVALPLLANSAGWLFTETARQPWLVYGLMTTKDGVSTNVSGGAVFGTLVGFTALYGVLGVICFLLVKRIAQAGPDEPENAPVAGDQPEMSLI